VGGNRRRIHANLGEVQRIANRLITAIEGEADPARESPIDY